MLQPIVASQSAYISGILRLPRSNSGSIFEFDFDEQGKPGFTDSLNRNVIEGIQGKY
jgi:hypothetical protein